MIDFQLGWRRHMNLLVGFFVISTAILITMTLIVQLSVKGMFNPEYRLYAVFEDGIGLRKGTDVLFNGVKVGSVHFIELEPAAMTGGGGGQVVLTLEIDSKYRSFLTEASVAYVMRDKNMVSDRVINIETPAHSGGVLLPGDTLKVSRSRDIETVLTGISQLMNRVDGLIDRADGLIARVQDPTTSVGSILGSRALYDTLMSGLVQMGALLEGSGKVVARMASLGDTLGESLPAVLGMADSTLEELASATSELRALLHRTGELTHEASDLMTSVESAVDAGTEKLDRADDLVGAVSDFWFIRRKIDRQREGDFPLMINELAP